MRTEFIEKLENLVKVTVSNGGSPAYLAGLNDALRLAKIMPEIDECILLNKRQRAAFYVEGQYNNVTRTEPTCIDHEEMLFNYGLIREELKESIVANDYNDLEDLADGLADVQVTLDNLWNACGLGDYKVDIMREVYRSNMTKLDANGKPVFLPTGKFTKSDLFEKPNLRPIIGMKEIV